MLIWHTADSWLLADLQTPDKGFFVVLRLLGGSAAPMFLFFVGVGMVFRTARESERTTRGRIATSFVKRGAELVMFGYLLRVQAWLIDYGDIRVASAWKIALAIAVGCVAAFRLLRSESHPSDDRRASAVYASVSLICFALSVHWLRAEFPHRLRGLSRVDVLQAIGGSMAIVGTAGLSLGVLRRHPWRGVWMALLVCLATPWLSAVLPGPLPQALAAYIARWEPPHAKGVVALFPLFPWMAYALVGAAWGVGLQRRLTQPDAHTTLRRWMWWTGAAGLALVLTANERHAIVYRLLHSMPHVVQVVRVGYRVGWCCLFLSAIDLAIRATYPRTGWHAPLRLYGRHSLLIYWLHMELAFGIAAAPLKEALGYAWWVAGLVVLCVLMLLVALGVERRQRRQGRFL
jgi:uncharacterized membrane protein